MDDKEVKDYFLKGGAVSWWDKGSKDHIPIETEIVRKTMANGWVLEVGVGKGRIASRIASSERIVVGVDISGEMLLAAKERDSLLTLIQSDCEHLPFRDSAFDSAYCVEVLVHVNPPPTIKEMQRVTRGNLLLQFPSRDVRYAISHGEVRTLLAYLGFVRGIREAFGRPAIWKHYTQKQIKEFLGTMRIQETWQFGHNEKIYLVA